MPAAPLPHDEPARLRMLRALNILDTDPADFPQAVSIAAASIANTPIGAVTLVDADRLTFQGACGVPADDMPRASAFCAHTILQDRPLLVCDTRLDDRFVDNPLVLGEPSLRFYAGFPLVVDGQPVGALCVIDDHVRALTDAQVAALRELAEGTASWLVRRDGAPA